MPVSAPKAAVILADTSIWVDDFRQRNQLLRTHLEQGRIVTHPFVIAELALGSLPQRTKTLTLLDLLPRVATAHTDEVRHLIEKRRLYALGIGLVDAHLIASSLINPTTILWTRDRLLRKAAEEIGVNTRIT